MAGRFVSPREEAARWALQWLAAAVFALLLLAALVWPAKARAAPFTLPACVPTVYGESTGDLSINATRIGWWGYHFCKYQDSAGKWWISNFVWACAGEACKPSVAAQTYIMAKLAGILSDTAAATQVKGAMSTNMTSCSDTSGDLAILCGIARYHSCQNFPNPAIPTSCAGVTLPVIPPPPPPAPEVWKVKPSGTAATRVVYTVTPTLTRGPLTNPLINVDIGATCNPAVTVTEKLGLTVTTYMGVPGGIAVCVKQ